MSPHQQPIKQLFMTTRIIWGSLLFSSLMLWFVLSQAIPKEAFDFEVPAHTNSYFPFLAAFIFATAIILPKKVFKLSMKQTPTKNQKLHQKITPLIFQKLLVSFIIRLALFEAIALVGFTMTFISKNLTHFTPFSAACIFGFFISFPTHRFFENFSSLSFPDQNGSEYT